MKPTRHIATAPIYGITNRRVGTRYLYTEAEIEAHEERMDEIGKPVKIRRVRSMQSEGE